MLEIQNKSKVIILDKFIELCENRDHKYIVGIYQNSSSFCTIWCNKHQCAHTTTFTNYKRSKTGMPCCGRQIQSEFQTEVNLKNNQKKEKSEGSYSSSLPLPPRALLQKKEKDAPVLR